MGLIRKLTEKEIGLVSYLANKANYKLQPNWLENLDIMPLDDGGMGRDARGQSRDITVKHTKKGAARN